MFLFHFVPDTFSSSRLSLSPPILVDAPNPLNDQSSPSTAAEGQVVSLAGGRCRPLVVSNALHNQQAHLDDVARSRLDQQR